MAQVKNLEDLVAEQAVRKAAAAYSRGADRCDLDTLKSLFHDDAEVKYGSYDRHYAEFCQNVIDGHLAMNYTSHKVLNHYYDYEIDANISRGRWRNLRSCFSINLTIRRCNGCECLRRQEVWGRIRLHSVEPLSRSVRVPRRSLENHPSPLDLRLKQDL